MTSLPPVNQTGVSSPRAGVSSPKAGGSPSGEHARQQHVTERLYSGPRTRARVKKTANDALVSSLSSDTLKWVKKRRSIDSQQKVVLSYHREKQLRTIFQGIDVNGHGFIDLADITEAVEYVKQKLKGIKGMEQFQNIQEIFSSMDEDGDGTVDFQEFTTAMTGSSKSVMDSASEYNIEKMYLAFIEFGTMKFRKFAIENIKEYTGKAFASDAQYDEINIKSMKDAQEQAGNNNSYDLFKSLFGHGEGMVSDQTEEQRLAIKREKQINADYVESILDNFRKLSMKQAAHGKEDHSHDPVKEIEYEQIEERLKNGRKSNLAFRLTDPDAIVQDQYLDLQKKLTKSNDLKLHRPKSAAGVLIHGTVDAGKTRTTFDGRLPEEVKREAEARKGIPVIIPVKIEQQTKMAARRDANEAWKSSSSARKARLSFMADNLAARNSKLAGGLGSGSQVNSKSSGDLVSVHSQKSHSSLGSIQSWKSSHSRQSVGLKTASRASFPNATSMVGGPSNSSILSRELEASSSNLSATTNQTKSVFFVDNDRSNTRHSVLPTGSEQALIAEDKQNNSPFEPSSCSSASKASPAASKGVTFLLASDVALHQQSAHSMQHIDVDQQIPPEARAPAVAVAVEQPSNKLQKVRSTWLNHGTTITCNEFGINSKIVNSSYKSKKGSKNSDGGDRPKLKNSSSKHSSRSSNAAKRDSINKNTGSVDISTPAIPTDKLLESPTRFSTAETQLVTKEEEEEEEESTEFTVEPKQVRDSGSGGGGSGDYSDGTSTTSSSYSKPLTTHIATPAVPTETAAISGDSQLLERKRQWRERQQEHNQEQQRQQMQMQEDERESSYRVVVPPHEVGEQGRRLYYHCHQPDSTSAVETVNNIDMKLSDIKRQLDVLREGFTSSKKKRCSIKKELADLITQTVDADPLLTNMPLIQDITQRMEAIQLRAFGSETNKASSSSLPSFKEYYGYRDSEDAAQSAQNMWTVLSSKIREEEEEEEPCLRSSSGGITVGHTDSSDSHSSVSFSLYPSVAAATTTTTTTTATSSVIKSDKNAVELSSDMPGSPLPTSKSSSSPVPEATLVIDTNTTFETVDLVTGQPLLASTSTQHSSGDGDGSGSACRSCTSMASSGDTTPIIVNGGKTPDTAAVAAVTTVSIAGIAGDAGDASRAVIDIDSDSAL